MRSFEFLWAVFLIISADLCRYWEAFRSRQRGASNPIDSNAAQLG